MQSTGGAKNPPWARSNVNSNMTGMNPQIMDHNAMMGQQGMMPFQQGQVFNPNMIQGQGGMAMPMSGQMPMNQMSQGQMYPGNVVAYPTPRALNPGMYQNSNSTQPSNNAEQRVFTGTVTKTHNDFGFVDHDVFYQTSVCAKGVIPKVNDRVLVEASYNPNMPFKWNATRVQVLPKSGGPGGNPKNNPKSNNYNAVPPPSNRDKMPMRRDDRMNNRRGGNNNSVGRGDNDDRVSHKRSRSRSRSRSRDRRDSRARRDSPPRKRPVVHQPSPVKYMVRVPRVPLDIKKMDVPSVSQRYNNLYIPSDFFNAHVKWGEAFAPQSPFTLNNPCGYHVMPRESENPMPNDAVLDPPDTDYRYSAKVMLISLPTLESLYQKCGLTKLDEKDKRNAKNPLHPTRLIKFLVGQKGKSGENFAIGGAWSPSLDGENPDSDPRVLVKTAIRTCKALTGIDLSTCAQWFRMVEFYYWREGSGGKPPRLETVVLFLPDVWSAQPSRVDWTTVQEQYKAAHEAALRKLDEAAAHISGEAAPPAATPAPPAAPPADAAPVAPAPTPADKSQIESDADTSTITIEENEDDEQDKPEPTHYSKIDLRTIKVDALRQELRARNTSCKGTRPALVSRLSKIIKAEEAKEPKGDGDEVMDVSDETQEKKPDDEEHIEIKDDGDDPEIVDEKDKPKEKEEKKEPKKKTEKEIEEEKRKIEREKQALKNRYEIPSSPHMIVHPLASAKGGRFNCTVASLSLLLDYRVMDNKEHSFEVFVFAELFNEMLMRDFGFYIYKTLYTLPEKTEEVKEKPEEKTAEKKDEKKEEKKEEKKDEKEKKEESKETKEVKRDEKRESRDSRRPGRDRRDSHSDDERSTSPKRRSRGVELPPDPYLLLSLVYFDTMRGGYMNKKDLQNLFMSLGLQLSRSQIRAIMEKVCIKDVFNYKTLMQTIKDLASGSSDAMQDMPLETTVVASDVPPHIAELENTIAAGNRDLLPVFNRGSKSEDDDSSTDTRDVGESGVVMYKSRVVDVGALVASEARNAAQRSRLEAALEAARSALRAARQTAASIQQAERGATNQLSDVSASLAAARARIASLTASSKIFHSALKSIQTKVEAVVNIKYEDDDVVEIVNGPNTPTSSKKDKKETDVKSETNDADSFKEETQEAVVTESEEKTEKKDPESDNIATENMDLDDKE